MIHNRILHPDDEDAMTADHASVMMKIILACPMDKKTTQKIAEFLADAQDRAYLSGRERGSPEEAFEGIK